jgi:hypothetical protein
VINTAHNRIGESMTSETDTPKALPQKNQLPLNLSPDLCLIMEKYPDISNTISRLWGSTELYSYLKNIALEINKDSEAISPSIADAILRIQNENEKFIASQRKRLTGTIEHRKHYRHPIHWRIALIHKNNNKNETYHGVTHNLSVSGASILVDHNIFVTTEVLILLAIPPLHVGQKETILEIESSMAYTVLDAENNRFRIGLHFLHFKGEGKRILSDILSKRAIPKSGTPDFVVI